MLAALIQSIVSGETTRAAKRVRRAMIDYVIAGICLGIGLGFLIAAAYIFVAERYGALYTAIGFGLGFIALAGVALIVHRIISGIQAKRRAEEARAAQVQAIAGAAAFAILPALLKGRGGLVSLLAPVAAMVAYAIFKENSDRAGDEDSDS
ncbi:MAG: hypothetical protein ABIK36_18370 [Pseudomonadota bacterium]